jgi:glyoxylase-like metal-dependent hydrolase (beta-lactamase superfamily II)
MDVEQIAPHLWHWTAPHPDWTPDGFKNGEGWQKDVSSYALVAGDSLVLFDPLTPEDEEPAFWETLDRDVEGHGPPAILLTVFWHARSSQEIADRYDGASIWAHEPAAEWINERVRSTNTFKPGDDLPGGVAAYPMHLQEEVAFWIPGHKAVVLGDAVLGYEGRADLCPPSWLREQETMDEVRAAARRILDLAPQRLLLTHGGPRDAAELEV